MPYKNLSSNAWLCSALLIGTILFSAATHAAKNPIAGSYVDPQQGEFYLLPDQQFLYMAHPVGISTGSYHIDNKQVKFNFDQTGFPEIAVTEYPYPDALDHPDPASLKIKLKPDQLYIQVPNDSTDLYIGLNQPADMPKLQKVLTYNAECFDQVNQNLIMTKQSQNTLILYRAKSANNAEISQQILLPDHINQIGIHFPSMQSMSNITVQLKNNALLFPESDPKYMLHPDAKLLSKRTALNAAEVQEIDQLIRDTKQFIQDYQQYILPAQPLVLRNINLIEQPLIQQQCEDESNTEL